VESLFSSSWYRVAGVVPRLRGHAAIHRHVYRGKVWYVLQDRATGKYHRFSPIANMVIGLMNGKRTLREIWEVACTRLGDNAPTQDEVINLLASLHRADVLQTDASPDIRELQERKVLHERMKLKQYIQSPLSLRIPLLDPDRFLNWINPLTRHLFGLGGAVVWLLVVGWALVLAASNWTELTKDMGDRLLSPQNLFLVGLVFPVAKIIHELGHAAAVKARGGEVHEMGIMLLVMMPIPYVEASASLAFREKRDRMLVGAAGMLAELFIAALAMFVWVNVEPGLMRVIAYNVMAVAGISTVVFNANPLLRFDGYYILADYLEIPNLGQRSNEYLGYLVNRHIFGVSTALPKEATSGERRWFVFYSIASFIYRMFVMVAIALVVAQRYFVIGVVFAVWSVYSSLIVPLGKRLAYLLSSTELQEKRIRALTVTGFTVAIAVIIIGWVPVPSWTRTEGVAVAPINAQIRASADGFIREVVGVPNRLVRQDDPLIVTEDPELKARVQLLEAQLAEQQARYAAAYEDRVQRGVLRDEIQQIEERLRNARRRLGDLLIRSPSDGYFVIPQADDAPGKFVRRGELLGYALDFTKVSVQVVVPQSEIDIVREMTRHVQVRLVESVAEVLSGTVLRVVPAATDQLPNLALSAQGGGEVPLDLSAPSDSSRKGETKAAATMFIFELELENPDRISALGSRIYVRFERKPVPLAQQWYREVRGLLLKKFNV